MTETYHPRASWTKRNPHWTDLHVPTAEAWQHHTGVHGPPQGDPLRWMHDFEEGELRHDPDLIASAYHRMVVSGGPFDGHCFEVRPFGKMGGATGQHNSVSHAICITGNFQDEEPTPAALDTAANEWANCIRGGWLAHGAFIDSHSHAPRNATACCGIHLINKLPQMRALVLQKLGGKPAPQPQPPGPLHPPASPATLVLGSHGDLVKLWQGMLNTTTGAKLKVDGVFGPGTLQATINFQRVWKLPADGIVGPNTWNHMTVSLNSHH